MDINALSSLSVAASAASTDNYISTAVLKMSLEDYEVMSAEMAKMMEMSVTPHIGQNFDVTV